MSSIADARQRTTKNVQRSASTAPKALKCRSSATRRAVVLVETRELLVLNCEEKAPVWKLADQQQLLG